MTVSAATGFWSYVRLDDENSQGDIQSLSRKVKARYQLITGDEIEIFFDRENLKWGEAWDERIRESIAGTTFFIPIITPSYLTSEACRAEFLQFWQKVRETPLKALLLPILYATIELSPDSDDEIVQAVRSTQYLDWRETQLEDERSAAYKRAINGIAERLKEISESIANEPDLPEVSLGGESDEDQEGVFEAIAIAEERFEQFEPLLDEVKNDFFAFSEGFTSGIDSMPKKGKFATKIVHLRKISQEISGPAERIAKNSLEVKRSLSDIRDAMMAATDFAASQYALDGSDTYFAGALETADKFEEIGSEIEEGFPNYDQIRSTLRQMTKLSRELKAPAQLLEDGMKNIYDCAQLFTTIAEEIRSKLPDAGEQ